MPRIPDTELERLKQYVSLTELCQARGIALHPHGSKDLIGNCPFHKDQTPSFIVSPAKNLFHCMGCDAAGSVIDFVMQADNVDFRAAVDKLLPALSRGAGPALGSGTGPGMRGGAGEAARRAPAKNPPVTVPPERANELLERVVAIYEKAFVEVPDGRAYLEQRGLTDAGLFAAHRVGYANNRLKELLPKDGQLKEELRKLGILLDNGLERFAGCVVFPVRDVDGNLVTLYGRRIEEPGARNAEPRTVFRHLFLPDRSTGLWNAAAVKTYSEIILVESVMDALSIMMAGHRNVLAIQGTNGFDENDAQTLKTHGVQAVTLLLDGDEAGKKATARLKEKIAASFSCRVLTLPDGLDPNAFLQTHGPEKLAAFLQAPENLRQPFDRLTVKSAPSVAKSSEVSASSALTVTCGLRKYRIMGLEKGPRKLKATVRVEHAGKLHVDTLDFYAAKSRRILTQDLCRLFEETPETIEADLDKLLRHCEQLDESQISEATNQKSASEPMSASERNEAETFGKSPALFDAILADCEKRGLMGERDNALLLYVAMTSRKRDVPLSVLILSSSGSGKTALQDAVLAFCPPEDLVKLTALSGKALFYKDRLSLKHKVLALEEGDGAAEAMYAIRNLISAGELTSESTIKDMTTGRLTTMENKVEGPSSVCFTTTKPDVDPETKSRFWVTSIDESRDQTRKILSFQRQQHLSDGPITSPEIEAILRKHRNFQRLLKPLAVKNPYAAQLAYGDDRLQGRRDQPKYLNLIKAIAFLRQMQKEVRGFSVQGSAAEYIEVDAADIALANRLAHEILGHSLDELSRPGHDLLLQLDEMAKTRLKTQLKEKPDSKANADDFSFSRRDIREATGWSNARVHRYLKELLDLEYVLLESGRNGTLCRYRLVYDGQGKDGQKFLLGLTDPAKLQAAGDCGKASGASCQASMGRRQATGIRDQSPQ